MPKDPSYEQLAAEVKELRRKNEQLIHSEKMALLGKMLATVSHELRSPLTILGLALEDVEKGQTAENSLRMMRTAVSRMKDILSELGKMSYKSDEKRTLLNLHEILEGLQRAAATLYRKRQYTLKFNFNAENPHFYGNLTKIEQIFFNFFSNSIDAFERSGLGSNMIITTESKEGWITVSFADDGPGVEEKNLPRLFEPYFTTKKEGEGTGLGLCVVQDIVRQNGGEVKVHLRKTGGLEFVFTLPNDLRLMLRK
ncbi:MAG: HAMP domain-containing sensor histidine kinase [Deltaproteobacteria bacterium]|nr:HAMP domain-containing sensor histidine kinase [Deltaproteobacteria bacterium]